MTENGIYQESAYDKENRKYLGTIKKQFNIQ